MGVHNLAEYVAYHQAKLREQNKSQTAPIQRPKARKPGVNAIHSKSAFEENVSKGPEGRLVLLDCFATWCGPCKAIAPQIAKWSEDPEYSGIEFYKVDVDEVPDVAQELGIRAMPTFVLFKDGAPFKEVVGANPQAIKKALDELKEAA